ncbi:MAG: MTH1187 family thiamine-binding protein [Thermosulfidibacteraceae bacterium]|jgi:uncharacterized protein (TIGR00106 family)
MPIAEIIVTPLGTGSPSLSKYVAKVERIIRESGLKSQLTPMSTIVEGELDEILELVKKVHNTLFEEGVLRVSTTVRIDERRDKPQSMESKVKAVEDKL